jgi:hypothetical protein
MMLVRSEMTKKIRKIRPTMKVLLLALAFIVPPVFAAFPSPASIEHSTAQGNRSGDGRGRRETVRVGENSKVFAVSIIVFTPLFSTFNLSLNMTYGLRENRAFFFALTHL